MMAKKKRVIEIPDVPGATIEIDVEAMERDAEQIALAETIRDFRHVGPPHGDENRGKPRLKGAMR